MKAFARTQSGAKATALQTLPRLLCIHEFRATSAFSCILCVSWLENPFKFKAIQGDSSLFKPIQAQKYFSETADSRQFLPISGCSACPITGPVKVSQSWSKLIQHKFYKMLCQAKTSTEEKPREKPSKNAKIKEIKAN